LYNPYNFVSKTRYPYPNPHYYPQSCYCIDNGFIFQETPCICAVSLKLVDSEPSDITFRKEQGAPLIEDIKGKVSADVTICNNCDPNQTDIKLRFQDQEGLKSFTLIGPSEMKKEACTFINGKPSISISGIGILVETGVDIINPIVNWKVFVAKDVNHTRLGFVQNYYNIVFGSSGGGGMEFRGGASGPNDSLNMTICSFRG
jgi:hypothetical protein